MRKNKMPKLSVIVPVYNVEQYLHKCVASILSQTLADFELILVNDGSLITAIKFVMNMQVKITE